MMDGHLVSSQHLLSSQQSFSIVSTRLLEPPGSPAVAGYRVIPQLLLLLESLLVSQSTPANLCPFQGCKSQLAFPVKPDRGQKIMTFSETCPLLRSSKSCKRVAVHPSHAETRGAKSMGFF